MTDPSGNTPAMSGHEYQEVIRNEFGIDVPDLAGMRDDNAVRFEILYDYLKSGGNINEALQHELDSHHWHESVEENEKTPGRLFGDWARQTARRNEDTSPAAAIAVLLGTIAGVIGSLVAGPVGASIAFTVVSTTTYYWFTGDENLQGLKDASGGQDIFATYGGEWGSQPKGASSYHGHGHEAGFNPYSACPSFDVALDIGALIASGDPTGAMATASGESAIEQYYNDLMNLRFSKNLWKDLMVIVTDNDIGQVPSIYSYKTGTFRSNQMGNITPGEDQGQPL